MKRFVQSFSLLLAFCIGGVISAFAVDFTPDGGVRYMIKCKSDNSYAIYNSSNVASSSDATVILTTSSSYTYNSAFVIDGNAIDGYTIKSATDDNLYVYYIDTDAGTNKVGVKTFDTPDATCKWAITAQGEGYNIAPLAATANSWAKDTSNNSSANVGLSATATADASIWTLENMADVLQAKADATTSAWTIGTTPGQIDEAYKTNINTAVTTFRNAPTAANYTAFTTVCVAPAAGYIHLESGYYRIKASHDDNGNLGRTFNSWIFSDAQRKYVKDASAFSYGKTLANVPATEHQNDNCYIWHVTRGTLPTTSFAMMNGQGTNGVTYDGLVNITSFTLELPDDYAQGHIYASYMGLSNNNAAWTADSVKVTSAEQTRENPMALLKLTGLNRGCSHWTFEKIDESELKAYTVTITGGDASCYVTRTATGEIAQNGGFFLVSANETPLSSEFESTYNAKKGTVTISGTNINVTYTADYDLALAEAQRVLAIRGVGYPTAGSDAYSQLSQAIQTAQTSSHDATAAQTLLNAITTYSNNSSDIQLPEDGHTYVLTNIHPTRENAYLNYTTSGVSVVRRGQIDANKLPASAKFTCHIVDGKYIFVNNAGLYLIWKGSSNGYSSACLSSYDATWAPMTVAKYSGIGICGAVSVGGHRGGTGNYVESNFVINKDLSFNAGSKGANWYQDGYSSAFLLEEVSYANDVTFKPTNDALEGIVYLATFSAPFPTVLPTGVEAYYVKRNGDKAVMTKVEGAAIPANQGVLLTSASADKVLMAPAAAETQGTIESNDLGHSAGAAMALTVGAGYILGNGANGVAFYLTQAGTLPMNRAYLTKGTDTQASVQMVMGSAVDGIEDIISATTDNDAPMYDLSGRRVLRPAKGGVYIQNGQKRIVK